jgi:hypothetical protein
MEYTPPIFDWIQDCFDPISEDDLCDLELRLPRPFPQDLRTFLLEFNAGYCRSPLVFPARQPEYFFEQGSMDRTMGIVEGKRWRCDDIEQTLTWFKGWIPSGLVPIASAYGSPICIGIDDEIYGQIYVWIHKQNDHNLHLVASSFTEFLSMLTPDPEHETFVEDLPIFQAVERGNQPALEAYLADGGKVDCRNAEGQTLLMCALRSRWPKLARLLVERDSALETVDRADRTPMYHAAMHQSLDGVKLLLAAGAGPHWCDERGMTLVKLARDRLYDRVCEELERHIESS